MQCVQTIGSSDSLTRNDDVGVTSLSASKPMDGARRGLNRLSVWQQHLLLQTYGVAWIGLVVAAMLYVVQPVQPSEGIAKGSAAPVATPMVAQPVPQSTAIQAVKVDLRTIGTKASTPM